MPSLLDRLSHIVSKAAPSASDLFPPPDRYGMMYGGNALPIAFPGWPDRVGNAKMSPDQRARLAVTSAWVFSDVQAIARQFSAAIIEMYETEGESETPIEDHPFERTWRRPNQFLGRSFMMQYWAWSLLCGGYGESYLFVAPGPDGMPAELWPMPAGTVTPVGTREVFIDHYDYRARQGDKPIPIDPVYIIYSHLPNPFDMRRGLDPLAAISTAVQTDLAQSLWGASFFGERNAVPSALATVPQYTSPGDFERIKTEIYEFFGGGKREVAVTRSGDLDFKLLSFNPEQMQFVKSREFNRDEIDRAFGIPQGYWSAVANRANSDHADGVLVNNIVWPLLVQLAEDANTQCLDYWYGESISAQFEDIRPINRQLELAEIEARKNYWTVDELRVADPPPQVPPEQVRFDILPATVPVFLPGPEKGTQPVVLPEATPPAAIDKPVELVGAPPLKQADLRRWRDKALKHLKQGRGASVSFESKHISEYEYKFIESRLAMCVSAQEIRDVFLSPTSPMAGERAALLEQATRLAERLLAE